jgi:hypothetical protein
MVRQSMVKVQLDRRLLRCLHGVPATTRSARSAVLQAAQLVVSGVQLLAWRRDRPQN